MFWTADWLPSEDRFLFGKSAETFRSGSKRYIYPVNYRWRVKYTSAFG